MSLSVCPITSVQASADKVWSLLDDPSAYANWWDVTTDSITPAGPGQPGQRILAHTHEYWRTWKAMIIVDGIDHERKELILTTILPLGITIHNHITVREVDQNTCRVSFG